MQNEIGNAAGKIWNQLQTNGETSLSQLKKATQLEPPVFEWAIGWLARENAIEITPNKKTYNMRLKQSVS
jgi:hypothetical protein